MRDGANEIQRWRKLLPDRLEGCLCLLHRHGVAPDDPTHVFVVKRLRKRRRRRYDQEGEEAIEVIWRLRDEFAIPPHHLRRLLDVPQHWASIDGMDRIRLEHKLGDDAEVAAAPTQGPEQIGIFLFAGMDKATVSQHNIGAEQVVYGESIFAGQVPKTASQGESANPSCRNNAAGNGQAKSVGGVVNITPCASSPDADSFRCRVNMHVANE